MAYRMAAISTTLSDLQGHSFTARLFTCDFLYSCAAVDKISSFQLQRRVVALFPLR